MTDEKRILAIETWATPHASQKDTIPAIGLKYINDLLEYIEDMNFLKKQHSVQETTDRIRKNIRKELEEELNMFERRLDVEDFEAKITLLKAIYHL